MYELKNDKSGDSFRCLITNSGAITLSVNGTIYNVDRSHPSYDKIKSYIKEKNVSGLVRVLDLESDIRRNFQNTSRSSKVEVKNGEVWYNGEVIHNSLTARILEFAAQELPFEPLVKFFENLMENPSKRAVDELYGFLGACQIPITSDGFFLSYKSLRSDYYDKFSGKILNKPGTIVEIPRNTVSDDCTRTCDFGLHTGGLQYSGPGGWYNKSGDKVVVVKVNPRDAVSVPIDHDMQKLRVCRYEVVRDFDAALDKPLYEVNDNKITEYLNDDDDNYEEDYYDFNDDDDEFENEDLTDTRLNYTKQKRDKNGRFC